MVTKPRDLRTGRSVWERGRAGGVRNERLSQDIETEVLIVGAGITGAMLADALADAGLRVVLVDRRGPAKGSTTASTALVQYEIDTPLCVLARKIGKTDATRAWRRSRLAIEALAGRFGELGIADVVRRDSLYLAGDALNAKSLEREHEMRRAAGLPGRFLSRKELRERFGIARQAAILGYGNLAIDPREAALALLREAIDNDARVFCPVQIVDIQPRRDGVTAIAGNGRQIHARHLVLSTGYEFPKDVPQRGHKIVSTWAIATRPQARRLWPEQCLIWEASEPYLYLRTTPDGRAICGGQDEEFADEEKRDALLTRKTKALERKLAKLFPDLDPRADYAWTGSFGQSKTGLPTIGAVPEMPNCYVALGYGGNGITYSRIAADIITGALTGRPDVDADLYGFRS